MSKRHMGKMTFTQVDGCMRTARWVRRELTVCGWKTGSVSVQCDAEKKVIWSSWLRTWKVIGGCLNPQSFVEYTRHLVPVPEGLYMGCVMMCVETTHAVGVGYVGATCNRNWKTCWQEMTVARQFPVSFIQTLVIGIKKPFKSCSSWGTSGWSLAEVIHKWRCSASGVHRFSWTSGGTSNF
jgi:hypothetical protein